MCLRSQLDHRKRGNLSDKKFPAQKKETNKNRKKISKSNKI